tara:strand:+ start:20330 stop:20656 length:327 start_codon:yes stop_codon:yes gene_type:complete
MVMPTVNNYQTTFINENMDQEFDESIKRFVRQMKNYFELVWYNHEGLNTLDSGYIEDLNRLIANYPSYEGYAILEDSFSGGPNIPIEVLSKESLELLDYFYGIRLHDV